MPGLNKYAVGGRVYGLSGRSAPNVGPTSNIGGYRLRDRKYSTRQRNNAILRKMQAGLAGKYMSSNWLKGQ